MAAGKLTYQQPEEDKMNFEELMKKMKAIDEGQSVEECGAMPIGIAGPSEQQDNVTMNVSMNGSGAGGIRDLMAIIKNIEDGGHEHGHTDVLVGEPSEEEPIMGAIVQSMGQEHDIGEEYENSVDGGSEPAVYGIDAVTQTGNDLASTGGNEFPKVNGGGNPMHESLVNRLSQMYAAIKEERTEEKDEKGNVVRWKEDSGWKKAEKKDGRGKVTNLSDKARRESGKMSKKETEVAEGGWTLPPADASPEERDAIMQRNKSGQDYINNLASRQSNQNSPAQQTEFVPHDYQTKEPLQKDQDGKWRNSKGEERDGMHGGPVNPGVNGGPSTARFRSLVPLAPKENIELAEMLKIAGLR